MIYLTLFLTFFKIGLFSFGGGYGMLPLMEQESVGRGWLLQSEFLNFLAISESTPGPIAINMATFIGSIQGGFFGGMVATLGALTPSVIVILLIVTVFKNFLKYESVKCVLEGIKPVIVGLIFSTGLFMAIENFLPNITSFTVAGIDYKALALMVALAVVAVCYKKFRKKNISPIVLIIASALCGIVLFR